MSATLQRRRELEALVGEEIARPVPAAVEEAVGALLNRHPGSILAVLYYGSCLRRGGEPESDSVLDFYVLVDRYLDVYANPLAALANRLLPPNVFYAELPWGGGALRVKYAILREAAFARGCTPASLHPRLWARFCQPVRLVFARDEAARDSVRGALADAAATMAQEAAPLLGMQFSAAELWTRAFDESYRTELRAERAGRAAELYAAGRDWYERITPLALAGSGERWGRGRRPVTRALWALRRIVGKPGSLLRLVKAAFTFEGGQGYLLWKIERHSGVSITPTRWQQRHPLLSAPVLAWRLYRRGAFR